jgi:ureidoglycolate lyase
MPLTTLGERIAPVEAQELTPDSFGSFGAVISSPHQLDSEVSVSANYGTAVKLLEVSPIVNQYSKASSGVPSKAKFNLFRCSPPSHLIEYNRKRLRYSCGVLERHPYSTQTFLPLGRDRNEVSYLVIVANSCSSKYI